MFQWIISSSVLIVLFVILRFIFKNRISARLQYALWLIVLFRLLIPFNLWNSSFSLNTLVNSKTQYLYYFVNDLPINTSLADNTVSVAPDFSNDILKNTVGTYNTVRT